MKNFIEYDDGAWDLLGQSKHQQPDEGSADDLDDEILRLFEPEASSPPKKRRYTDHSKTGEWKVTDVTEVEGQWNAKLSIQCLEIEVQLQEKTPERLDKLVAMMKTLWPGVIF